MATNFETLLKYTRNSLAATEANIKQIRDARDLLTKKELPNAKARIKRKESPNYPNKYSKRLLNWIKRELPGYVKDEIDKAFTIETSEEFYSNAGIYKAHLYRVATDKTIYTLSMTSGGWSAKPVIAIVFDSVAGTLEDYARGIIAYRKIISKKPSTDGAKATRYWEEHVYGSTRYDSTIAGRLLASQREAPFWSLIAHGSSAMSSDHKTGSYNPYPSRGYNFVEFAEDRALSEFNSRFESERLTWEDELKKANIELSDAENIRDSLSNLVKELTTDFKKNEEVFKKFGPLKEYIDKDKLAEALRALRAGEEFETPRVELTKKGSSKRIRPLVRKVEGFLED